MKKARTRVGSILLTLALVLTLLPVTAGAIDYVASVTIGGETTEYESLQTAMDAAAAASMEGKADVEVKLLQNVDLAETEWTSVEVKSITIDGQGHTISNLQDSDTYLVSGGKDYGAGFIWKAAGALTIKNITFDQASICKDSPNNNVIGIVVGYTYGTTVFEDVTVTNSEVYGYGKVGTLLGMGAQGGVSVTFTDCVSTGNIIYAMYDAGGLAGNIQRGKSLAEANVTITGCTVNNRFVQSSLPDHNYNNTETIETKVTCSDSCVLAGKSITGTFLVDGTYYWPAYAEYYCSYGASSHDCQLEGSNLKLANSEYLVGPVAEIGGVSYSTLEEAIAAAQDGDTVKLLADVTMKDGIELDKSTDVELTLDLNGYTYTVEEGANVSNRGFKIVSGTLNVVDSSSAKTGTMIAVGNGTTQQDGSGAYGVFRVEKDGVLNVTGVTLKNSRPWGLNVKVCGGIATLTDVTIFSSYGGGIEVTEANLGEHSQAGQATMNNCTVTQTGYYDHASSAVSVSGGSKLIVNGGTYTSETGTGIYVFSSGGFVEVLDGTFSGGRQVVCAKIDNSSYPGYEGGVELKGGYYTGVFNITSPATLSISGGTFSSDPSDYLATGYEITGSGPWTVKAKADGGMAVTGTTTTTDTVSATLEGVYMNTSTEVVDDTSGSGDAATGENDNQGNLTVTLPTEGGTTLTTASLTIKEETAASLSKATSLTLLSEDVGSVTLNAQALDAIAKADDDVVIQISNENGIYTVTATANGDNLLPADSSDTNGEITISVPYTGTVSDDDKVVVFYISDDGTLEAMDTTYDPSGETLTWATDHLSKYGSVEIGPNDEVVYMATGGTLTAGTLSAAIDALNQAGGGSITLVKDIENLEMGSTVTNNAVITLPAGTTLNGDGHTITAGTWDPSGTAHILGVNDCNGKVVVKNLTIVGNSTTKHGFNAYGKTNTPDVTLENVTINNCGTAAVVVNHAKVTVINLTTSGNPWGAVNVDKGGELDLQGNANNMGEPVKIWTEAGSNTTIVTEDSNYSEFEQVTGVGTNLKGHTYFTDDVSDLGAAYNETTSTIYETLDEALTKAADGNTITVVKSTELTNNAEVGSGVTLVVNSGVTLTIPDGKSLTNKGTIENKGAIDGIVTTGEGGTPIKSAVTFSVTPSNASITVTKDGGTVPAENDGNYLLEDGSYSYTVSASGYYAQSGTFTVAGQSQTISVRLTAIPTTTPDTGSSSDKDDDDDDGYSITIPASSSVRGGSISVNPRRADKGDTVTITVTPDDGYVLKDLTVTVRSGGEVDLTRKNSSQYTFKMPAGAVVIEVSFVESDSAAEVEMSFADVPADYWAVSEIQWAFENGYMNGTSATTFNPGGTVSRQQVWMILARMAGANPADMAAAKAWAVESGISDGTNPGGGVTRQQLVALLYRFAAQNGYDTNAKADLSGYPDVASLASYAADAMAWSVANGIIGGTTQGTLNPAGTANRAQFAVILWRFYQTTAV